MEIDDKIKNKLAMMTEGEGLSAIEELSNIKREEIRSFSSYFMGIMNRYGEAVGVLLHCSRLQLTLQ
jgi:hypothetical protein